MGLRHFIVKLLLSTWNPFNPEFRYSSFQIFDQSCKHESKCYKRWNSSGSSKSRSIRSNQGNSGDKLFWNIPFLVDIVLVFRTFIFWRHVHITSLNIQNARESKHAKVGKLMWTTHKIFSHLYDVSHLIIQYSLLCCLI